jgi:hypothetical protein
LSPGYRSEVAAEQASAPFELGGQALTFVTPAAMHSAGMVWLKMQITYSLGGTTGAAQFILDHARRNGFKTLLSIKGLKNELAANPTSYYQNYAAFVAQVALLNPEAIEVWNEPNIDVEWPVGLITGVNYANMLKQAYPAIKAANPNVMVISGAPAPTGYFGGGCASTGCDDKIFIEQMATAGAAPYFDCTGIHYNEGVLPPTASSGDPRGNPNHYSRYYPTMVSTYRTVFPTKPLCFTELGYISPEGLGGLPPGLEWGLNTLAQEQADWLAQAAVLSRNSGIVRLMIVWNVDAQFVPSNTFAGWAMIRTNNQCLPCATLSAALADSIPARNYFTVNTVPLTWTNLSWATAYQIQVDSHKDFILPLEYDTIVGGAVLELTTPPLGGGLHYWRVRSQRADGSWGVWSSVDSFQVASP